MHILVQTTELYVSLSRASITFTEGQKLSPSSHDFDGGFDAISLIAPAATPPAPVIPVARAIAPAPPIVSD